MKYVIWILAAVGVLLAGNFIVDVVRDRNADKREVAQKAAGDTAATLAQHVLITDTTWQHVTLPSYTRSAGAARGAVASGKATDAQKGAAQAFNVCDTAIAAEEKRIATRDSLIRVQNARINLLLERPERSRPRLIPYVEGMYDARTSGMVARVGIEARVIGPLLLKGEVEAAARQNVYGEPKPNGGSATARVGVRYEFKH